MKILVSIDDTDNLESRGTGKLAALLVHDIEENGWGTCDFISRHQLLVHPDVPYTSHNSAMCFTADIMETNLHPLIAHAALFLEKESADGSDPGLCVAVCDQLTRPEDVIAFGRKAKQTVLAKSDAYGLAAQLDIHLSEHGGTGGGVIGALAGVGLRLSGHDGRMRGKIQIDCPGNMLTADDLCRHPAIDNVRTLDGENLSGNQMVELGEKVKPVLLEGKRILLVVPQNAPDARAPWITCPKHIVKTY